MTNIKRNATLAPTVLKALRKLLPPRYSPCQPVSLRIAGSREHSANSRGGAQAPLLLPRKAYVQGVIIRTRLLYRSPTYSVPLGAISMPVG